MKNYIIIAVVVAAIIFFIMQRKKKADKDEKETSVRDLVNTSMDINKPGDMKLDQQIVEALKSIADEYGIDIARKVEQMSRLETDHYRSGGFKATMGMGMEVPKRKLNSGYPFGWPSMKAYWDKIGFIPTILDKRENDPILGKGKGPVKHFIVFPNVFVGLRSLAHFVKNRKWEEWRALDPVLQSRYRDAVNKVTPKITNKFA